MLLAGAGFVSAQDPQDPEGYSAELKYRALRDWTIILPNETWTAVDGIPIPNQQGKRFATERTGLKLAIDTDADGRLDTTIKGTSGYAVLRGRGDGGDFEYALRARLRGEEYEFAASGAMAGMVRGVQVQVIDQNNDGDYADFGVDAMIVGETNAAHYLSKVVTLKGELYDFAVTADGRRATVKPYAGASGTLSLRKGVSLQGQLLSAVVSAQDEAVSFNVVDDGGGLRVPVGSYTFTGGFAKKGGDSARLRVGKMRPLVVESGATATLTWGAPLVAEFGFTRDGNDVTVTPEVHFYGRAGEELHTLLPDAKSPKLLFFDAASKKLLASKRFEGC